jgi:serine/threonine-protein kinase
MVDRFGLRMGEITTVEWSRVRGRPVPVREDTPVYVFGHWEAGADLNPMLVGTHVVLPNETRLTGQLYVKEGRVYGRFTEAHTPGGDTYPMCLELLDADNRVGVELEPGGGPGNILVEAVAQVRVVDRFK